MARSGWAPRPKCAGARRQACQLPYAHPRAQGRGLGWGRNCGGRRSARASQRSRGSLGMGGTTEEYRAAPQMAGTADSLVPWAPFPPRKPPRTTLTIPAPPPRGPPQRRRRSSSEAPAATPAARSPAIPAIACVRAFLRWWQGNARALPAEQRGFWHTCVRQLCMMSRTRALSQRRVCCLRCRRRALQRCRLQGGGRSCCLVLSISVLFSLSSQQASEHAVSPLHTPLVLLQRICCSAHAAPERVATHPGLTSRADSPAPDIPSAGSCASGKATARHVLKLLRKQRTTPAYFL